MRYDIRENNVVVWVIWQHAAALKKGLCLKNDCDLIIMNTGEHRDDKQSTLNFTLNVIY